MLSWPGEVQPGLSSSENGKFSWKIPDIDGELGKIALFQEKTPYEKRTCVCVLNNVLFGHQFETFGAEKLFCFKFQTCF